MKVWNKRDPNCPKDAIYVGRPSKWGNPFPIGKQGNRADVIRQYKDYLAVKMDLKQLDPEALRGKDLVCWCHNWDGQGKNPLYCHADILLEIANK
jgi:hypothetical protein